MNFSNMRMSLYFKLWKTFELCMMTFIMKKFLSLFLQRQKMKLRKYFQVRFLA